MNNMYLKKKVRYPEVGISNPYLYITKISFPSSKGLYNWCLIYLTKNIFPDMKKKKKRKLSPMFRFGKLSAFRE